MIRAYIRTYAWRNATADDLLSIVRAQLGAPIEAGMRSFLEQPGVPRIAGTLECKTGQRPKLVLRQQRALPAGTTDPAAKTWKLPVCARFGTPAGGGRACAMLDGPTGELALEDASAPGRAAGCPTWVLLNGGATGYYRSVVDPAMARALLTPSSPIARAAKPTAAEKMMLIADLAAMVERDELALDKLLELVPVVAADPDDKVAMWALTASRFRMDVLDDTLYPKAKRYFLRTFGPAARRLGWTRGKDDSDERHELRRALVPSIADQDAALEKQGTALADRWIAERKGPRAAEPRSSRMTGESPKGLDDDLVRPALATAARRGDQARFDKLLAAAKSARDREEQQKFLSALGAFRDPAIAKQALEVVRGTEIDLRDSQGILYGVLFARETRALGIEFVKANIDGLLGRMRDDEASWFLGGLASFFCTVEERKTMEALVVPRAAKYPGAQAPVTRGLEQSQQCIANTARQLPALRRVLERY
jgi:aminopeptidase N